MTCITDDVMEEKISYTENANLFIFPPEPMVRQSFESSLQDDSVECYTVRFGWEIILNIL